MSVCLITRLLGSLPGPPGTNPVALNALWGIARALPSRARIMAAWESIVTILITLLFLLIVASVPFITNWHFLVRLREQLTACRHLATFDPGTSSGTSFQILLGGGQMPSSSKIEFVNVFFYRIFKCLKTCRPTPPSPPTCSRNFEWYC